MAPKTKRPRVEGKDKEQRDQREKTQRLQVGKGERCSRDGTHEVRVTVRSIAQDQPGVLVPSRGGCR